MDDSQHNCGFLGSRKTEPDEPLGKDSRETASAWAASNIIPLVACLLGIPATIAAVCGLIKMRRGRTLSMYYISVYCCQPTRLMAAPRGKPCLEVYGVSSSTTVRARCS